MTYLPWWTFGCWLGSWAAIAFVSYVTGRRHEYAVMIQKVEAEFYARCMAEQYARQLRGLLIRRAGCCCAQTNCPKCNPED